MCTAAELDRCPFQDECSEWHPEDDAYREKCSSDNCENCARYWVFLESKHIFERL